MSVKERTILFELAMGRSVEFIAEKYNISRHTVKAHISAILAKLGVRNRASAVFKALKMKLIK